MAGHKLELEELNQDLQETKDLLEKATRKRLKNLLSIELIKLETKLKDLNVACANNVTSSPAPAATAVRTYTTIIRNYSWDQSEKFLKLYLTLKNVQSLNKEENIKCNFEKQGLDLKVMELEGKNHELAIAHFAYPIVPEKSYFKVKPDMLVVFAAKSSSTTWEAITWEEKRALDIKKASRPDPSKEDPSAGLMGLMKQMYDDGDDETKRMLNKTWYESQQKKEGGGGGDMPGMGGMGGMMGGLGGMMGGLGGMGGMAGL